MVIKKKKAGEKPMYSEENELMNDQQLNIFLETIAQLIEAKAVTVEEAAKIVRESKV